LDISKSEKMPLKLFSRFSNRKSSPDAITIVSGLPRSGTSMMMQMLQAGGMQILTDHQRSADDDNPKGYYEFERVKKLKDGDTLWVKEAQGKVVKVVSALLQQLPGGYSYRVVFMLRNIDEILASQKQMLVRRQEPTDKVGDEKLAELFEGHLKSIQEWLSRQPNFQVLYVNYNDLIQNSKPLVEEISIFLDSSVDKKAMLEIPDRKLYRQRS
jgi:hypothetical protein